MLYQHPYSPIWSGDFSQNILAYFILLNRTAQKKRCCAGWVSCSFSSTKGFQLYKDGLDMCAGKFLPVIINQCVVIRFSVTVPLERHHSIYQWIKNFSLINCTFGSLKLISLKSLETPERGYGLKCHPPEIGRHFHYNHQTVSCARLQTYLSHHKYCNKLWTRAFW